MPTPSDLALCDDIVDELNTRWKKKLTASREYVVDWKAKGDVNRLQVAVVPGIDPIGERVERGQTWVTWPVVVGFAQRLQLRTKAEIDNLVEVVDAVRVFLQESAFVLGDGRRFEPQGLFEFLARYDPDKLNREEANGVVTYTGAFLSVVRFEFRELN